MQALLYTPELVYLYIRIRAKKKHVQAVLSAAYDTISPTHKEEGCLEYRVLHEGTSVIIMGKWTNSMSLDMHLLLQFHLRLIEEILPPLCKKITLKRYREIEPPITSLSIS